MSRWIVKWQPFSTNSSAPTPMGTSVGVDPAMSQMREDAPSAVVLSTEWKSGLASPLRSAPRLRVRFLRGAPTYLRAYSKSKYVKC
jgi:hypothetical protein